MSFELPATDYAEVPDSEDILDSLFGVDLPGQNWWESAVSASLRSVPTTERESLTQVSPLGKRCVITSEPLPVQLAHLIPKYTKAKQIRKYQFTFGRKLDINSHWFCMYLEPSYHILFDYGPPTWALIPTPAVITRIANKLREEKARRLQLGTQGPWPDYRQPEWFPITNGGIDCHFIPLGMTRSINRLLDPEEPNAAIQRFHPPSFEGFPILRLSAHPYATILNAAPKLKEHLETGPLPFPANTSYEEIQFIHDTLTNPPEIPDTSSDGSIHIEQGSLHGSNAGTESGISDIRSRLRPRNKPRNANESTSSHQGSAQQVEYNDLFEAVCDGDANRPGNMFPQSCLSDSTPDHPDAPPKEIESAPPPLRRLFMDFKHQGVAKWIAEVERACGQNALVGPDDDSSPGVKQYAAEPARAPPTMNWHDCMSEFAPWWVLLPELKKRGVLSSNDRVEIANLPPLTRKLDWD